MFVPTHDAHKITYWNEATEKFLCFRCAVKAAINGDFISPTIEFGDVGSLETTDCEKCGE